MEAKFILWDRNDGRAPRVADDGVEIVSDGVTGRIGVNNVYLTAYAQYPDDVRPRDLAVGDHIRNVIFSLSGSRGSYDLYRVS